ncbi:MAG TPA: hypothetical protein VLT90_13100 [Terriglobales bacterium]|nr:hypothetical protein [Terriglobales bacterium]
MKPIDEWIAVTWGDLAPGDYTRLNESRPIFQVEAIQDDVYTLARPGGTQTGRPDPAKACLVRTQHEGRKTEAGYRLAYLEEDKVRLLKEQLGAEMIAVYGPGNDREFTPWIFGERYSPAQLSSHLFMFHGLYVGEPPKTKELKLELLETHKDFHKEVLRVDSGRRLPHIHNQTEYDKMFQ